MVTQCGSLTLSWYHKLLETCLVLPGCKGMDLQPQPDIEIMTTIDDARFLASPLFPLIPSVGGTSVNLELLATRDRCHVSSTIISRRKCSGCGD